MKTPEQLRTWALQMSDAFGCTAIQALGMLRTGLTMAASEAQVDVDEDGCELISVSNWSLDKMQKNVDAAVKELL